MHIKQLVAEKLVLADKAKTAKGMKQRNKQEIERQIILGQLIISMSILDGQMK